MLRLSRSGNHALMTRSISRNSLRGVAIPTWRNTRNTAQSVAQPYRYRTLTPRCGAGDPVNSAGVAVRAERIGAGERSGCYSGGRSGPQDAATRHLPRDSKRARKPLRIARGAPESRVSPLIRLSCKLRETLVRMAALEQRLAVVEARLLLLGPRDQADGDLLRAIALASGELPFSARALWVLHAYALDAFFISPILGITSPVNRCGKTLTLIVLGGAGAPPHVRSECDAGRALPHD